MKVRDFFNNRIEVLGKLVACKRVVVKFKADNAVFVALTVTHDIKNGKIGVVATATSDIFINDFLKNKFFEIGRHTLIDLDGGDAVVSINPEGNVKCQDYLYSEVTTGIEKVNINNETSNFINNTVTEMEAILGTIPQITSYKSGKDNYTSTNSAISQQITECRQKALALGNIVNNLKLQVDQFQLKNNLISKSPEQRSHILEKILGNNDFDSVSIINAIKECGFNPNHASKEGKSLINQALVNNDLALFDLLIANKIDFNSYVLDKTICQLILTSNNKQFIDKMFITGQDLSKALLNMTLNDDASSLAIVFEHNAELTKTIYSGCSLLELALKKSSYKAAEQILKNNPEIIHQVNSSGLSPLAVMLVTDNKNGIDFLKAFGAEASTEVKIAVTNNHVMYLAKVLTNCNEVFEKIYDGLPLGHFIIKHGNSQLLAKLLELKLELSSSEDSQGRSMLYFALLMNKLDLASLLIDNEAALKSTVTKALLDNNAKIITDLASLNPEVSKITIDGKNILYISLEQNNIELAKSLLPISDTKLTIENILKYKQIDLLVKLSSIDNSLLSKLAQGQNNLLTQELIGNKEFVNLTDDHGNGLLHLACLHGNQQLVYKILTNNPENISVYINKQNENGKTALHLLLESTIDRAEKVKIAEIILSRHPDITLEDSSHHTTPDLAIIDAEILTIYYQHGLLGDANDDLTFGL